MKPTVALRIRLTEPQAERLQQRLALLPFKIKYQEELHGSNLLAYIGCTAAQEQMVREILNDLGAANAPLSEE